MIVKCEAVYSIVRLRLLVWSAVPHARKHTWRQYATSCIHNGGSQHFDALPCMIAIIAEAWLACELVRYVDHEALFGGYRQYRQQTNRPSTSSSQVLGNHYAPMKRRTERTRQDHWNLDSPTMCKLENGIRFWATLGFKSSFQRGHGPHVQSGYTR